MDDNTRKAIEKVGQKAAIDLQRAMENMNQRMDDETRKISEDLKEITRRQDCLQREFDHMEKILLKMARHMGIAGDGEVYESDEMEETQYHTPKGKGICAKEKSPQRAGQMSGTMLKIKVPGQTHEGPFILRPLHSFPPQSTIPQAYSSPQQQYWQLPGSKQQCSRNLTPSNTANTRPKHQGFRPFQDPQPKAKFTPIPTSYARVYAQLKEQGILAPSFTEPIHGPPFPKWYNPEESCVYHNGIKGHDIENCISLKHKIENLLSKGFITFDEPSVRQNVLPQRGNEQINMDEGASWFQGIKGHAANKKWGNS